MMNGLPKRTEAPGFYTHDFVNEYVSLTEAKHRSIQLAITIHNWLRGRGEAEFLGQWETLQELLLKLSNSITLCPNEQH